MSVDVVILLLHLQIGKIEFHRLNSMKSGISAAEFLEKEPAGLARGIEMRNLTKVFSTGKGVLKNLQMATLCTTFLFFSLPMGPRDYQIYLVCARVVFK